MPPALPRLRLIAPAAPGGGWDQTARAMQQVLVAEGLAGIAPVENISGAAGTIGLARFVTAEAGHGDALMVTGLVMLGATVFNESPIALGATTPIARLTGEYEVIVVPASSPFGSLRELLEAFTADPGRVSWGGGSAGGTDQILVGMLAHHIGISANRANYIAFSGGGESAAAVLGAQVTAGVSGLAEFEGQIRTGGLRALAISSRHREPGIDIPTLREQGVDVELANWRAVVAPPQIAADDRHRLTIAIERMARSDRWQGVLRRMGWADLFLAGPEFDRFLVREHERVTTIVRGMKGEATLPSSGGSAIVFPAIVGLGLLGIAIGLIIERRTTLKGRPTTADRLTTGALAGVGRPFRVVELAIGIILNLALFQTTGFVAAAAVLFWFTARAFGSTRPIRDAVVALAVSGASFLLFARGLGLALP